MCPASNKIKFQLKFGLSMLWIQMSAASGVSVQSQVWLCMFEQGLGWLIRARGHARVGSVEDAWTIFRLSTFQRGLKLLICLALSLMCSFRVTKSASLCLKPAPPPKLAFCLGLHDFPIKALLVLGGLWKIYNRCAVFEGHVFSNHLFLSRIGWVVTGPNVFQILPASICSIWVTHAPLQTSQIPGLLGISLEKRIYCLTFESHQY